MRAAGALPAALSRPDASEGWRILPGGLPIRILSFQSLTAPMMMSSTSPSNPPTTASQAPPAVGECCERAGAPSQIMLPSPAAPLPSPVAAIEPSTITGSLADRHASPTKDHLSVVGGGDEAGLRKRRRSSETSTVTADGSSAAEGVGGFRVEAAAALKSSVANSGQQFPLSLYPLEMQQHHRRRISDLLGLSPCSQLNTAVPAASLFPAAVASLPGMSEPFRVFLLPQSVQDAIKSLMINSATQQAAVVPLHSISTGPLGSFGPHHSPTASVNPISVEPQMPGRGCE